LFKQLKAWCNYRHPKKPLNWIARKYWHTHGGDNYSFQSKEEDEWLRLLKHGEVSIKRHIKVQKNRSPYDGDWVYWGTRLGRNPKLKSREAHLLKQQKGKCAHCGLFFKIGDLLETDHITPKTFGGKDTKKNWQLLHRHCHDEKTLHDRSNDKVCMTNT
jgi:RNA-directed DNA polymerase